MKDFDYQPQPSAFAEFQERKKLVSTYTDLIRGALSHDLTHLIYGEEETMYPVGIKPLEDRRYLQRAIFMTGAENENRYQIALSAKMYHIDTRSLPASAGGIPPMRWPDGVTVSLIDNHAHNITEQNMRFDDEGQRVVVQDSKRGFKKNEDVEHKYASLLQAIYNIRSGSDAILNPDDHHNMDMIKIVIEILQKGQLDRRANESLDQVEKNGRVLLLDNNPEELMGTSGRFKSILDACLDSRVHEPVIIEHEIWDHRQYGK